MPRIRDPDPISPPVVTRPLCPACGKDMRCSLVRPHHRFTNLDDCVFQCDCGEEGNYVMARKD